MNPAIVKQISLPLLFILSWLLPAGNIYAQTNFLLNGDFEDINTCTEYDSECGVEAWFYLKDVKAQMISNEENTIELGNNSFGVFFNWSGYKDFSPLIGTILPCRLQKDTRYTFRGMIKAKLNPRLDFKPGIVLGEKFYVPGRPFSANMHPDSIISIKKSAIKDFFEFEFSFLASGREKYLTFGTYIQEDTVAGKNVFLGVQTISVILDNFQLLSSDNNEVACNDLKKNKAKIYNYNFRHKEMDYSLFGKGELKITFDDNDSNHITRIAIPPPLVKTDTLKLGDVFFDYNKASLKPEAIKMLENYFIPGRPGIIDSIYIEGHTDSIGSDASNIRLSRQRCESMLTWLEQNNITDSSRLQVHPFGETRPVATNSTAEGRALNRRVELVIFRKPLK